MTNDQTLTLDEVAAEPARPHGRAWMFLPMLLPLAVALAYAGFLTSLPVNAFIDRSSYLEYTYISDIILIRNQNSGIFATLFNEPIWLLVNIWMSQIANSENTIRVFIFSSAFLASLVVLNQKRSDFLYLLLFIFFSLFIKNYIIHLRQGLALAVFLAGFYSRNKYIKSSCFIVAPFIHSSFFFLLMILAMSYIANRSTLSVYVKIAIMALFFVILGLAINIISSGLGARQGAEYVDAPIEVSGVAFAFWMIILGVFVTSSEKVIKDHLFEIMMLTFYLCTYFTSVVSGRVFESAVITILVAGLSLTGTRKHLFLVTIGAFMIADYVMRSGQPAFGWGIV